MIKMTKIRIGIIAILLGWLPIYGYAQLTDGMTGLLHMVTADMQKDATVMIGGNLLNKHNNEIPLNI